MSYIIKKNDPLINLKLTDLGRQNLSNGDLNFAKYGLGDSEMNYTVESANISSQYIFRPVDKNPGIQYPLAKNETDYLNEFDSLTSLPTIITGDTTDRGFFIMTNCESGITSGCTSTIDSDVTVWSNLEIPSSNFDGSNILTCISSGATSGGTTGTTIDIGDYLMVKLVKPSHTDTVIGSNIEDEPLLYLWYVITSVTTNGNTHTLTLDREIPNFSSSSALTTSYGFIYPGENVVSNFDHDTPTSYWDDGLLDFSSNCTNSTENVPIWNFNIYNYENNIGISSKDDKGKEDTIGESFAGAYTYFRYAEDLDLLKIGIIHYTNNTVSNYYGEGFNQGTLSIHLPTLMWHKKEFAGAGMADSIGYTFVCDTDAGVKTLGNDIRYYDLVDQETTKTIVGKVFIDQKVVVVEHPDLLVAMSIKSNRNFTLPKPILSSIDTGICDEASTIGAVQPGETLYVTYMFGDQTNNLWYQPCEDFGSVTIPSTGEARDVQFKFDNTTTNSFAYLFKDTSSYGYNVDTILVLTQVVSSGNIPESDGWRYFNANNYVGGNGCLSTSINLCEVDEYELFVESSVVTNENITNYKLSQIPIGDVLVSINGVVQTPATNSSYVMQPLPTTHALYSTLKDDIGDYTYSSGTNEVNFKLSEQYVTLPTNHPETALAVGDVIQFHYLVGTAVTGGAIQQNIVVPNSILIATAGIIYQDSGMYYMDLDEDPEGTVYLVYNGTVLSSSNYNIVSGGTNSYRIQLTFTPTATTNIAIFYISATATATTISGGTMNPIQISNLVINVNYDVINAMSVNEFVLSNFITIPSVLDTTFSFGDENFFFGNLTTDIKATIFKTLFTINVLPNTFITSQNPTFNENSDKVKITEIGIYDEDDDLVAIGKFSQPLVRLTYSDVLIIKATIDF